MAKIYSIEDGKSPKKKDKKKENTRASVVGKKEKQDILAETLKKFKKK